MVNAWEASTVVAGAVGFFTVLRGSAFAAHALPNGAFAGASLIGANVLSAWGSSPCSVRSPWEGWDAGPGATWPPLWPS